MWVGVRRWFVFVIAGILMSAGTYFAWLFGTRYGTSLQEPMLTDDEIPKGACAGCTEPYSQGLGFGIKSKVGGVLLLLLGIYCMFSGLSVGGDTVAQCAPHSSIDIGLLLEKTQGGLGVAGACEVSGEIVDLSKCDQ